MLKFWSTQSNKKGFTLLVAVLVAGVVLSIGISILSITLKEFQLSGIVRESEIALFAADAGTECANYWDSSSSGGKFDVGASDSVITCMGQNVSVGGGTSGAPQEFEITWNNSGTGQNLCTKVAVTKFYSPDSPVNIGSGTLVCPAGATCTRVESYGYNKACANIDDGRTVERAFRVVDVGSVATACPAGQVPIPNDPTSCGSVLTVYSGTQKGGGVCGQNVAGLHRCIAGNNRSSCYNNYSELGECISGYNCPKDQNSSGTFVYAGSSCPSYTRTLSDPGAKCEDSSGRSFDCWN